MRGGEGERGFSALRYNFLIKIYWGFGFNKVGMCEDVLLVYEFFCEI